MNNKSMLGITICLMLTGCATPIENYCSMQMPTKSVATYASIHKAVAADHRIKERDKQKEVLRRYQARCVSEIGNQCSPSFIKRVKESFDLGFTQQELIAREELQRKKCSTY